MNSQFRAFALLCGLAASAGALAAPSAALLERYAAEARAADPAFAGFSAARGEALHRTRHGLGKPDTPACTSCHGENARAAGHTAEEIVETLDRYAKFPVPAGVSGEIAETMRQIRLAEAQGRPAEALRRQLAELVETLQ